MTIYAQEGALKPDRAVLKALTKQMARIPCWMNPRHLCLKRGA